MCNLILWYILLIVMLVKICSLWLFGVIVIIIVKFDYIIFMMFELYTLVFLYLVLNEGSSYERGGANTYLIIFGYVISFSIIISNNLIIISLLLLLLSMSKLPMYGVHIWLPKVHVEASILGSIILAGSVLNLSILYYWNFGTIILVSIIVLYSVWNLANIIDGNGFAAYSSVMHITCCVILSLIVMLLVGHIHIVLSPLIFITIYLSYMLSGSRIYINSGLIILVLWIVNFGVPFCSGFFAEVYIISYMSIMLWSLVIMYLMASVVIINSINSNVGSSLIYLPWFVLYIIVI